MSILKFSLLVGFMLLILPTNAQEIEVNAPEEVFITENFQIQYRVYSNDPIRRVPKLIGAKDFEILSEPQIQRSNPSPFWGRNYYTSVIIYTVRPKKEGKLKLPKIEIQIENTKIVSKETSIKVLKDPQREDINCFVKVSTTKTTIAQGDTLILEYRLYSTDEISKILSVDFPKTRILSYNNITPKRLEYTEEKIDGVVYKVYIIGKYILFGEWSGIADLPEGEVSVEYLYPTGRMKRDTWGRVYEEQFREVKTCVIDSLTLKVHNMTVI